MKIEMLAALIIKSIEPSHANQGTAHPTALSQVRESFAVFRAAGRQGTAHVVVYPVRYARFTGVDA
jgi:hypothetical protein